MTSTPKIVHYYRETEPSHSLLPSIKEQLKSLHLSQDADSIQSIDTETCFNVQLTQELGPSETKRLEWLLAETFEPAKLKLESTAFTTNGGVMLEFGPRMSFASAFSSNAVSICHACGLSQITRLEQSKRYKFDASCTISDQGWKAIKSMLHDRMTQEQYMKPIESFDVDIETKEVTYIPIMEEGRKALEKVNAEQGLGFDDFDLDYYTNLFKVS